PGVRLFQRCPFGSGFGTFTPRNELLLPKSTSTVCAWLETAATTTNTIATTKCAILSFRGVTFMRLSKLCGRDATQFLNRTTTHTPEKMGSINGQLLLPRALLP